MSEKEDKKLREKLSSFLFRHCLLKIEELELGGDTISRQQVREVLDNLSSALGEKISKLTEQDYRNILFKLESMPIKVAESNRAILVKGGKVPEWLLEASVDWDFWSSYRELLRSEGKSNDVIAEHERVIDSALDMSGDPRLPGPWAPRKGLIMGNVQAGKTMNFVGLLNKALDVGYHTIIVLGGHMNELRKQAQIRIDEGLIGRDTSRFSLNAADKAGSRQIGVAHFPSFGESQRPSSLTSRDSDFNSASRDMAHIQLSTHPVVFVIKKNVSVMKSLTSWLESFDMEGNRDKPMILIDDEADYASINTKASKNEYAATNKEIKNLLALFQKPTYVGYTATPFANVFIPYSETVSGELDDDLFPSDFMLKMPIPPNYQGQDWFFPANTLIDDAPYVKRIRNIDERTGWLPLKHKKDVELSNLHDQLDEAVCYFICVIAVRYSRGQTNCHNTMLINVSRFNDVQAKVAELVSDYLYNIQSAVKAFGAMDVSAAKNASVHLRRLDYVYSENFSSQSPSFEDLLAILVKNVGRVKVEMVNGLVQRNKENPMSLNYEANKEKGLWVIAIGGLKLSRGLTLEGLSVSFFLRNSLAYDTLTQMCRWFGYHPGFEDLCRLYLLKPSYEHYSTVAQSIRELYQELKWMELTPGSTPRDFGLKVRASDTALLITAKNKMGSGKKLTYNYRLWGEPVYYFRAHAKKSQNEKNYSYLKLFLQNLNTQQLVVKSLRASSYIYDNVSYDDVISLVSNIDNPSSFSKKNEKGPVKNALGGLKNAGMELPTVVLFSRTSSKTGSNTRDLVDDEGNPIEFKRAHIIGDQSVNMIARSLEIKSGELSSPNTLVGDNDDLKCLFKKEALSQLQSQYTHANKDCPIKLDNALYRRVIRAPVVIIYLVSAIVNAKQEGKKRVAHGDTPTVMYAIHFPDKNSARGQDGKAFEHIPEMDFDKSYITNEILRGIDIDDVMDEDAYE